MANTYGDNGNRWWVGLNTAVNNQTVFGTQSPIGGGEILNPAPSGYESLPSGNAADDAQFAAAAKKNAAIGAKPVTISVENINWYNIRGPYTTQAVANAAIPSIQKANPAPGVATQIENATGTAGPINALIDTGQFLSNLSNPLLWLRAAKVVAGGIILIVGLAKLTGADKTAGGIAAKAVKAAPLL